MPAVFSRTEFLGTVFSERVRLARQVVAAMVVLALFAIFSTAVFSSSAEAADPLHQRIDQLVNAAPLGPLAPVCSDAEFVRRVSLDLNGMVPTATEAKAFIDDASPDKRVKLIDKLIASPRFARHVANSFSVMLMERRPDAHVPVAEWDKFLFESFLANKPYDQLVRELIATDGTEPTTRPAAKFFLERTAEPNLITRDIGRLFFGRDLQCAQCHDSPLVDDFKQVEYYGLQAFVARTVMFNDEVAKKQMLGELAAGEASFASVFTKESGMAAPRVPAGPFAEDPSLPIGEEYVVRPADKVRPVPKHSRRIKLAEVITTTNNAFFQRNIANRLWALMLGRGIVHPLDLIHSDNPPTQPELLDMLTAEIAATKYDVRSFLREIALTQTYQRSIELPADWAAPSQRATELLAALTPIEASAKTEIDSTKEAAKPSETEFDAAKKAAAPIQEELNKAIAAAVEARKQFDAAQAVVDKTQAQIVPKQEFVQPVSVAAVKAAEALAKIPDDAELKKVTEFFQTRTAALNTEIAALIKARDDQAAAAKSKNDAFTTVAIAVNPIREKWLTEKAKLDAARDKYEVAQATLRAKTVAARITGKRLSGLKSLAEFNALTTKTVASQAAYAAKQAEVNVAQQALTQAADEVAKKAAEAKVAELSPPLATAQQQAKSDADALAAARESITQFCTEHFYVASLKPLTPEQLAASLLNASGHVAIQTTNANNELDKSAQAAAAPAQPAAASAPAADAKAEPPKGGTTSLPLGGRERQVEENVFEKLLRANAGAFVIYFGAGAGQPPDTFFATADQALYFGNGGTVHSWAGLLASQLTAQQDPKLLAESLYLSTLTRLPTEAEVVEVTNYLQSRGADRVPALQEMVWGLLSSAEFRFNH